MQLSEAATLRSPRASAKNIAATANKRARACRAFHAALANRDNSPCNVYFLSDSVIEGQGIATDTTPYAKRSTEVFAKQIRSRFPTVGETNPAPITNFVPATNSSNFTNLWTYGTAAIQQTTYGLSANAARLNTAGNTATITIPAGTTSIAVGYVAGSALTGYTATIDGADVTSSLFSGMTTGSTRSAVGTATVSSGSAHTLVITTVGTNNYLYGIWFFAGNETKGVRVFNAGHSGSRIHQYLQQSGANAYGWINPATLTPSTTDGLASWTHYPRTLFSWGTA